jgi:kynurenine formamidase
VDTPKIEIHTDQRIRQDGPFWAWNWLKLGEHSGTHFDAPHHWITGKDYADGYTDTIPCSASSRRSTSSTARPECAADPDFLLTIDHVKAWEAKHGAINKGEWVVLRTDWDKRADEAIFLNADATGPHTPGPTAEASSTSDRQGHRRLGHASASAPMPARPAA